MDERLYSSFALKTKNTATGHLATKQGMPIISHFVVLPLVCLLNQFYFSRDRCLSQKITNLDSTKPSYNGEILTEIQLNSTNCYTS